MLFVINNEKTSCNTNFLAAKNFHYGIRLAFSNESFALLKVQICLKILHRMGIILQIGTVDWLQETTQMMVLQRIVP